MPKRAAISATGISAVFSKARIVLISLAESLAGRPSLAAPSASGFEASEGSFPDQIPFELGQRGKDVEDQPPSGRLGFNLLGQRFEILSVRKFPFLEVTPACDFTKRLTN